MQRRRFLVHSAAHAVNDLYSGFLAPLLPLLASKHSLGLAGAGLLVTVQTIAASLSQALWGLISDRFPSRWYVPVGIFAAGIFLSLVGAAPHLSLLIGFLIVGGSGVACFHPPGAVYATALTQRQKGLAMALFIAVGSAGYALGPVFISGLVSSFSLERSYYAIFPALVMVPIWLIWGPKGLPHQNQASAATVPPTAPLPVPWKAVILLSGNSMVRALILMTFINFLPFMLKDRGFGLGQRSLYLFTLQFGDAVGNLVGGLLADRLGRWQIMAWTPVGAIPLFLLFLHLPGAWALLPLFFAGLFIFASAPAVVVSSQKLMPRREGLASALQVGFAWGCAGLFMSGIGRIAEIVSLNTVLHVVSFLPLLMAALIFKLKDDRGQFEN